MSEVQRLGTTARNRTDWQFLKMGRLDRVRGCRRWSGTSTV